MARSMWRTRRVRSRQHYHRVYAPSRFPRVGERYCESRLHPGRQRGRQEAAATGGRKTGARKRSARGGPGWKRYTPKNGPVPARHQSGGRRSMVPSEQRALARDFDLRSVGYYRGDCAGSNRILKGTCRLQHNLGSRAGRTSVDPRLRSFDGASTRQRGRRRPRSGAQTQCRRATRYAFADRADEAIARARRRRVLRRADIRHARPNAIRRSARAMQQERCSTLASAAVRSEAEAGGSAVRDRPSA